LGLGSLPLPGLGLLPRRGLGLRTSEPRGGLGLAAALWVMLLREAGWGGIVGAGCP